MSANDPTSAAKTFLEKPVFACAGFIVLDLVEPNRDRPPVHLHVGGTAGNVAAILASLGWESYPLARLSQDDPAYPILVEDLGVFGVRTEFLNLSPTAPFPMLIQRRRKDGSPQPIFTFRCPRCGQRMPGWSPLTDKTAVAVADELPPCRFFLIDRFTRGNLTLARSAKQKGASIVFEPASLKAKDRAEVKRFQEALSIADILKYSHRQFPDLSDAEFPRSPCIEVCTKGSEGLRLRQRLPHQTLTVWEDLAAFPLPQAEDTCGAGDWLTAVLVHLLGETAIDRVSGPILRDILIAAQAAAAWACQYSGARGGMYGEPGSLASFVAERTRRRFPLEFAREAGKLVSRDITLDAAMREFCSICRGDWIKAAKPASHETGQFGAWRVVERPGYAGRKAASSGKELDRRFGPGNWRIVYTWRDEWIPRDRALDLYVDAYVAQLKQSPELLDWLTSTARDVYDISPRDVESGTDFSIQREAATHLQDIAVRIAIGRLGRTFQGRELVQIRGKSSAGSRLSPGIVPFHEPDGIAEPELEGWWQPGSVESFWQSNKYLQAREWESRIFVFGGSFNPIHNGHLRLARFALDAWGFDRVIFVPNGDNYRKETLRGTPARIRLEMVKAAIRGETAMDVLDVEVRDPTPVRTPVTMSELSVQYPTSQLALYRGLDSLHRTHRDCFRLTNVVVLALARKGFELTFEQVLARHRKFEHVQDRIVYVGNAFEDELSSTQVREAVRVGRSITEMVPAAVELIVRQCGLYKPS